MSYMQEHPELVQRFDARDFHPRIVAVARKKFVAGDFPGSISQACISVEEALMEKVGFTGHRRDIIGESTALLEFKVRAKQEADGAIALFRGIGSYLRNPKAHVTGYGTQDATRALEWLGFLSVMMRVLDDARLKTKPTRQTK